MATVNAREELLEKLASRQIKCARIVAQLNPDNWDETVFILKVGHSPAELETFLQSLNFEYNQIGLPVLDGNVWLTNGQWLERFIINDIDNVWAVCSFPPIPTDCI